MPPQRIQTLFDYCFPNVSFTEFTFSIWKLCEYVKKLYYLLLLEHVARFVKKKKKKNVYQKNIFF